MTTIHANNPVIVPWTYSFHDPAAAGGAALSLVGGKGANLALLSQAGLPVPGGFLVTTRAYWSFVQDNDLQVRIETELARATSDNPDSLNEVSGVIRAMFDQGQIAEDIVREITSAYHALEDHPAVAVRSSATAEDLPQMSFAGQQDTYLNIIGDQALLRAVVQCWSSLWTARAIGYRMRNRIHHQEVGLAVVVQRMVEAEVSGVMFTANPLSGLRSETVIDATLGLGEALVSGLVEPDHYVVDTAAFQIREKTLGAKALSIHGQEGGGTQQVSVERKNIQALPDHEIVALARLGIKASARYDQPQDIEWAWENGNLYILQSRSITSLFPTPQGMPASQLQVMVSFAAVQGMLDPITPLGRNTLQVFFQAAQGLYAIKPDPNNPLLAVAGERLWLRVTALVRNSVGRKALRGALVMVEPTIRQAIQALWDDPQLQPEREGIRPKAAWHMLHFFSVLAWNVLLNLASPARRRDFIVHSGDELLTYASERYANLPGSGRERLMKQVDLFQEIIFTRTPRVFIRFVSLVASAMASFVQLNRLAGELAAAKGHASTDLALEVTRGLPHNPTTEMDLALWEVARAISADPGARTELNSFNPEELSQRYLKNEISQTTKQEIDRFLARYGRRGLAEIDLGRSRWNENPAHIFEVLGSYLQIEPGSQAPDAVFARSEQAGVQALDTLVEALRQARGGWLKARLARFFGSRARQLMGTRESPKFFMVRLLGLVRSELLKTGQELVAQGELNQPDDVFFLTFSELRQFAERTHEFADEDWTSLVAGRREAFEREKLRRQIPRVLLSDGRAFYEGLVQPADTGDGLHGSPVSPGLVEGAVRVVLDPRQAGLLPGEILVCPGTDPSWTPLFLSAGGLIMEVGGMMTHGAVVAREYGIPAVVGVDRATTRLQTGDRVRLDGSSGRIERIDG